MSGRLLHYSSKLIEAVYSVTQDAPTSHYDKPRGLWVSVEGADDWRSWCEAESFGNPSKQICHEITLVDGAKILRIESAQRLRRFAADYEFDPYMSFAGPTYMSRMAVDWKRVAAKYDGIIIAPYQWSCRLDAKTTWYYGWDCASGCIWNARAIERICVAEHSLAAPSSEPPSVNSRVTPEGET